MDNLEVRKAIANAKFNGSNSSVLFGEVFIASVSLGVWSNSWWIFGAVLLLLIAGLLINPFAVFLCFMFGLAWGVIGWYIGSSIINNLGASVVLSIIGLVAGLGCNLISLEWMQDINAK